MDFDGFDWDKGNRDKCQQHCVPIQEIERMFDRPVVILPDKDNPSGEQRHRAIGTTPEHRGIFVVFTLRDRHGSTLLRPISARYMHKLEVENYEKTYPYISDRQAS